MVMGFVAPKPIGPLSDSLIPWLTPALPVTATALAGAAVAVKLVVAAPPLPIGANCGIRVLDKAPVPEKSGKPPDVPTLVVVCMS